MKNKVLFLVAIVIMMIAILCVSINRRWVSLPDWAVRTIGVVMLIDLITLVYSTARMKHKDNV